MRTTLDIDDDVLRTVKERARIEKKTAGQVLSEAARKGLAGETVDFEYRDGIPIIPKTGRTVTQEIVDKIRDEDWL